MPSFQINEEYVIIKEKDKKKYLPSQIVQLMKDEGYSFKMHTHTLLWKEMDAKNPSNNYGKIPTSFLMCMTGHSTEKMFLTYIGKSNKDIAMELTNYF